MIPNNDTMNLYKMCKQLTDMIGKSAENTQKLGGVVEKNTDNINDLAVKLLGHTNHLTELADKLLTLEKRLDSKK